MAYADLDGIHTPAAGNRAPASWGLQVNANFDAVYSDVLAKLGAWTAWTPSLVQAGSVSKTVNYADYFKLGRFVVAQCSLAVTGSGSSATAVTVSLPVTAATSNIIVGTFYLVDATGPTVYIGAAALASTGTVAGVANGTNGNALGAAGFTAALASGDAVFMSIAYEAAS